MFENMEVQYKDHFSRYREFHYTDKMVIIFVIENSYTGTL